VGTPENKVRARRLFEPSLHLSLTSSKWQGGGTDIPVRPSRLPSPPLQKLLERGCVANCWQRCPAPRQNPLARLSWGADAEPGRPCAVRAVVNRRAAVVCTTHSLVQPPPASPPSHKPEGRPRDTPSRPKAACTDRRASSTRSADTRP